MGRDNLGRVAGREATGREATGRGATGREVNLGGAAAGGVTPEWITELRGDEVFVFGSNLEGKHLGGAARLAHRQFGAEWGIGKGKTGQCYAIPTMHGGLEEIRPYVEEFIEYAKANGEKRFLLTRVGCGIAGFKDEEMAELFREARGLSNVTWPKEWEIDKQKIDK